MNKENFGMILTTLIGTLVLFIFSYPLMLLWNNFLVPAVSTLNEVGWLQMWGISILLDFLFKPTTTSSKP